MKDSTVSKGGASGIFSRNVPLFGCSCVDGKQLGLRLVSGSLVSAAVLWSWLFGAAVEDMEGRRLNLTLVNKAG